MYWSKTYVALQDERHEVKAGDEFVLRYGEPPDYIPVVNIEHKRDGLVVKMTNRCIIPSWMLLDFAGEVMRNKVKDTLDDMSGVEFLNLLKP